MTAKQQYFEQMAKECREQWFKNHVATVLVQHKNAKCCARDHDGDGICDQHFDGTGTFVINWQEPGTWIFGVRYVIHANCLFVMGDVGEAVYCWNQTMTPAFLKGISFDYFFSKCSASESGRKFVDWNSKVAAKYCAARIEEIKREGFEGDANLEIEELKNLGDCGKEEYETAARNYYDECGDAETASAISTMGEVPSGRAIGHFVGLQMALEKLF